MGVQSLHGLAVLKRQSGQAEQSRRLLETAIHDLEPCVWNQPTTTGIIIFFGPLYFSLSKTLLDLGEKELADEAFDKARSFKPVRGPSGSRRPGPFGKPPLGSGRN